MKPLDYVITYSGREVSPSRGVPSIEDLALALSRQPRFGGMCRRHWTVVDHSLFAAMLAQRDGQQPEVQLALLLHDAHEWTGDIPTHFKTKEQRSLQHRMDAAIQEAYFKDSTEVVLESTTKHYDIRALLAEAMVVGPPIFKTSTQILEHFGQRPRLRDVVALVKALESGRLGVHPSELVYKHDAANVRWYLHEIERLQNDINARMTAPRHSEPVGFIANETRGNNDNE
jgi:hypothetical protein